jgi:uroporphyrinogen-III synthase
VPTETPLPPLTGRRIGVTADRRWKEQSRLFETRGATVVHGPTMKTVDLTGDPALRAATAIILADPPDVLVATTGMGVRMWLEAAAAWGRREELLQVLGRATTVARGAKSQSALRQAGLEVTWSAPHETMAEVLEHVRGLAPGRVAVQLFEPDGSYKWDGAEVVDVPVYRWRLPDDPMPARALATAAVAGELDAVTFTSQPAVHHLFRLAPDPDALRDALNGAVLAACIGPVCAAAAHDEGLEEVSWPDPNRLVAMVQQVTERLAPASG